MKVTVTEIEAKSLAALTAHGAGDMQAAAVAKQLPQSHRGRIGIRIYRQQFGIDRRRQR